MAMLQHASTAAVFEPAALRGHRLFHSHDLDEARDRISRVMQPHELRRRGARLDGRGAHMDFTRVGSTGLGTIDFGASARVEVDAVHDYHLVMFCLRGHAEVRAGATTVQTHGTQGVICAPGDRFEADLSPDCEQFVLRLDRRSVQAHAGRDLRFAPALDLRSPGLQAWLGQLQLLAGSASLVQTAQERPLVARELERLLLMLLMAGQPWTERDAAPAPHARSVAPGCVRRAEQYMDAHATDPLRLDDIAAAAGVPVRTLLEAFKRFRAHSPMQHLRELRLQRARALLQAGTPGTRVSTVALDCGFAHLGRFAQDYQARYGEAPSATLTRSGSRLA